jgi:hypothetical protein
MSFFALSSLSMTSYLQRFGAPSCGLSFRREQKVEPANGCVVDIATSQFSSEWLCSANNALDDDSTLASNKGPTIDVKVAREARADEKESHNIGLLRVCQRCAPGTAFAFVVRDDIWKSAHTDIHTSIHPSFHDYNIVPTFTTRPRSYAKSCHRCRGSYSQGARHGQ